MGKSNVSINITGVFYDVIVKCIMSKYGQEDLSTSSYPVLLDQSHFINISIIYLIGINLPGRNLPIFEKGGKFLPGNLKHGQVMERRLKKKSSTLTMTMTDIL